MKVILQLSDGREMIVSEVKNIYILEDDLESNQNETEISEKPTEGKWFKVNPLAIDKTLFKEERVSSRQESIRLLILDAFEELKKNLKYAKPFKTMMPQKTWDRKTVKELKELASNLGNHNADWVEQAFEWAQRIANGESWEDVCDKKDTANWYRLIVWKDGYTRIIYGARECDDNNRATYISRYGYREYYSMSYTVPLVVSYE